MTTFRPREDGYGYAPCDCGEHSFCATVREVETFPRFAELICPECGRRYQVVDRELRLSGIKRRRLED